MTTTQPTLVPAVVAPDSTRSQSERRSPGSWPGTGTPTATPTASTCAVAGLVRQPRPEGVRAEAGPHPNCSLASNTAVRGRPWRDAYRQLRGSTGTASKSSSSQPHLRYTCVAPVWTTNQTPPVSTATNSARSWPKPASPGTRPRLRLPARSERSSDLRSAQRRHRAPRHGTGPDTDCHPHRRQDRHHPRPGDIDRLAGADSGRIGWQGEIEDAVPVGVAVGE